jgi:hypothetical protein
MAKRAGSSRVRLAGTILTGFGRRFGDGLAALFALEQMANAPEEQMPAIAHVADSYGHYAKQAEFRGLLESGPAELKLYHLFKPGEPVAAGIAEDARTFLVGEAKAALSPDGDRGFAILHRCGATFHFLLLGAWRGSNELWEAVFYRDAGMDGFAAFPPAYEAVLRPTFCVWQLGIVAHESLAWTRLLSSPRGEEDLERWRADVMSGEV